MSTDAGTADSDRLPRSGGTAGEPKALQSASHETLQPHDVVNPDELANRVLGDPSAATVMPDDPDLASDQPETAPLTSAPPFDLDAVPAGAERDRGVRVLGDPSAATMVPDGAEDDDTGQPETVRQPLVGMPRSQDPERVADRVLGDPSAQTITPQFDDHPSGSYHQHASERYHRDATPQSASQRLDRQVDPTLAQALPPGPPSVPAAGYPEPPAALARGQRPSRSEQHPSEHPSTHGSASASLTGDDLRALSQLDSEEVPHARRQRLLQARAALDWDTDFQARYRLREAIGHGGVSDVFVGAQASLQREVAVKVGGINGGGEAKRFRAEAMVTAYLEHPNIIPVYDAGDCYLAMKRIRGSSLDEAIGEAVHADRLPEMVEALVKVTDAIAYAHEHGVVHRDLKSANVMVGRFGEVLVLDWGLAARSSDQSGYRGPSGWQPDNRLFAGTPACMAPEVAKRVGVIGPWIDVFGLGAMIYQVLTGRLPFSNPNIKASVEQAARNAYQPVESLAAQAPGALVELQQRAMATEPGHRPSVNELGKGLRHWLQRSDADLRAGEALREGRVLLGRAQACSRREWDDAFRWFVQAVAAYDRAVNLAPSMRVAVREREQAMNEFAHAALRSGSFHLARMLAQGYSLPVAEPHRDRRQSG